MQVTVFRAVGDTDGDDTPLVYEGLMIEDQILAQARELGGVGKGGYAGVAIARTHPNQFLVTYAKEAPYETEPYGESGVRVKFEEQGDLSYEVAVIHTSRPEWIRGERI